MNDIILVTGGTGLVGTAIQMVLLENPIFEKKNTSPIIIRSCNEKWIFLSSKNGDLRNIETTKDIFKEYGPTYVLHLAAFVGGLFCNMKYKVDFFRSNIYINDNILECSRLFQIKKVISCLSTCIFPDKTTYPIDETMIHNGPPHPSNEGYAYAKRMLDVMNKCYFDQYKTIFTSVIPTNIYGINDNFNIENAHVIPGLIHKCYIAKKNNQDFVICGTGKPLRQFIYNKDLAKLMIWAIKNYANIEPIILTVPPQDEISIKDIAFCIAKHMDFQGNIQFDHSKPDGQYKKTTDNRKLLTYLPNFQFTPIDDAMKETIEWFKRNYDTCRK